MARICAESLDISPLPALAQLPLTLDIIRQHCHIDAEMAADVDALLNLYLRAAIYWFENETHRSIVARTHRWNLGEFPYEDPRIRLPRGKTQSIASITYRIGNVSTSLTGFQQDLS